MTTPNSTHQRAKDTAHCIACSATRFEETVKTITDALNAEREDAENASDDIWIATIAKHWNQVTGKPFDERDGESREEAIAHCVCEVTQEIEDQGQQLGEAQQCIATLKAELSATQAEARALGNALATFGKHKKDCNPSKCDCGLAQEIQRALGVRLERDVAAQTEAEVLREALDHIASGNCKPRDVIGVCVLAMKESKATTPRKEHP